MGSGHCAGAGQGLTAQVFEVWPKEGENKVPEGFNCLSSVAEGNRVCGAAVGTGSSPNEGLFERQQCFCAMAAVSASRAA